MPSPAHTQAFFATTGKNMEPLLAAELRALGLCGVRETRSGAAFTGSLEAAYRVCLWSRVANRVLLVLHDVPAETSDAMYEAVKAIPWEEHLRPEGTLTVDFAARHSPIRHSRYGAQRVKDAVVDRFRGRFGRRPNVDPRSPDLRVNVFANGETAQIGIDLSGESLHRRGYRLEGSAASLKENLAAAMLLRAGWPACAERGGPLVDPMCGAGTLPIEAALMAGDVAPGLLRKSFGVTRWLGHDPAVWECLMEEAQARRAQGLTNLAPIYASDRDPRAVEIARENARRAGVEGRIRIACRDFESVGANSDASPPGLVVMNPPYGERLGERASLVPLYGRIGTGLKMRFPGWRAAILTGGVGSEIRIGLKPAKVYTLFNGGLECKVSVFDIDPVDGAWEQSAKTGTPTPLSSGADMFANRLRKNLRSVGTWARRANIACYRLYDADLPEYAVAVDVYGGAEGRWVHVQEYEAPVTVDPVLAARRVRDALAVIPELVGVPTDHLFFKIRRRQKGKNQYRKLEARGRFYRVDEAPCRFWVNFTDYLDTGLFLDHRPLRSMIRDAASGKRFLNLFGYTGTATAHAAAGGAQATTTVDMSRTYIDWAERNLSLNGFHGDTHQLLRADCMAWLRDSRSEQRGPYGLIFADPPSFSNSKRMVHTWDVQRDHVSLIQAAMELLADDGVLLFSNNRRGFKLDADALKGVAVEDISAATIPRDFRRNSRIHRCWRLRWR